MQQITPLNNYIIPQNVEAEEAILGGILIDPEAINRVANDLPCEAFTMEAHRLIYTAARKLQAKNKSPDLMNVAMYLLDHKLLEKVGGQSKLVQLSDRAVSAVNIDQYAALVAEKYIRRQLIERSERIRELSICPTIDLSEVIEGSKNLVDSLPAIDQKDRHARRVIEAQRLADKIKEVIWMEDPTLQELAWDDLCKQKRKSKKSLLELALKVESLRDIPSDDLDWAMPISKFCKKQLVREPWLLEGFLKRGRVALFAAESKCGKSLVMYDICHGVGSGEGWGGFPILMPGNVLILQTDEPDADCQDRLKFRGLNLLDNTHVITQFNPVCQLPRLERIIRERKIDFVAIDSLTSCGRFSGHSVNDPEAAYFVYQLRDLASRHGVTILLIHHLNKAPTKGLDKVAGTYGIPAACSDIFLLTKSDDGSTRRKFQRLGGRNGEPKIWEVELNPEDNSWTLLGRDEQEKDELGNKIITHLAKFAPTPFSRKEIALAINENPNTVGVRLRDMYGDGLITRCKQGRAYAYFLGSDQLISSDLEPDHFANPDATTVSTPTDQLISKIDVFLQVESEGLDQKNSKISDQLITSHSNPVTISVRPTDLAPDHLRSVDHFEPPTYLDGTIAQIGDRVICRGQRGTIAALDRQTRGSAKEPFSIWWVSVELMSGETAECNLQSLDRDNGDDPPPDSGGSPKLDDGDKDDGGGESEECDRESESENKITDRQGMIISMAKTSDGIRSGQKRVTRRDWSDKHAALWCKAWDEGRLIHQAWDKSPRSGGKFLAAIELTARPYQEQLGDMPETDVALECVPEISTKEEFINFVGGDRVVWVVRFKVGAIEEIVPETNSDVQFAVGDRVESNCWLPGRPPGTKGVIQSAGGKGKNFELAVLWENGAIISYKKRSGWAFKKIAVGTEEKAGVTNTAVSPEEWEIEGFRKGDRVRLKSRSFFKGEWHKWPHGELIEKYFMPIEQSYWLLDIRLPSGELIRHSSLEIELDLPIDSIKNFRFGDRFFVKDNPSKQGCLLEKGRSAKVIFDGGEAVSIAFSKISPLQPEADKNSFFRAWGIFQKIDKGTQLRAGKHPDHLEEKCTNKVGKASAKRYHNGKFEAHTEDLKIFNLEAVKVL